MIKDTVIRQLAREATQRGVTIEKLVNEKLSYVKPETRFEIKDVEVERSDIRGTVMLVFTSTREVSYLKEERVGLIFEKEELIKQFDMEAAHHRPLLDSNKYLKDKFSRGPLKKAIEDFLTVQCVKGMRSPRFPIIDCTLVSHACTDHRRHGEGVEKDLLDSNDYSIYVYDEERSGRAWISTCYLGD